MNIEDITKSEKTLSEMKQKIRKLKKTLRDPNSVCEFYDVDKVREEIRRKREPVKAIVSHESLEAGFAEMQKLDECLRKKQDEEKAVKLSRMQEEEDNCEILTELLSCDVSDCIKNNSEQFLRLVNGWEPISHTESLESLPNSTDGHGAENAKKEKSVKRKGRNAAFIEKNILLAKCGNGVLSLTDEEKIRIENLLKEPDVKADEKPDDSSGPVDLNSSFSSSSICSENLYVLSEQDKDILDDIDQKLKEFSKLKLPDPVAKFKSGESDETNSESKESSSGSSNNEKEKTSKKSRKNGKKKFFPLKDEGYRLREVDKLIGIMNAVSNEEISPLSEEDIKILVEKVKLSLDVLPPQSTERSGMTETTETTENESKAETQTSGISMPLPSPETVFQLIEEAKSQMPNFKYRYST